jgi:SapC
LWLEAIVVNLVVLDNQIHREVRIAAPHSAGYAAVNAVSVIPREFPRLLAHYPIFFTKSADTGQFEPAALLGFRRDENLFLSEGRWDAAYVPLQIQRQPFSLLPRRSGEGEQGTLEVALDMDSPQIQTQEGERLFSQEGQATKFLQNITSMLSALVSGSRESYEFTRRLAELELIEPVQIKIEFVDGSDTQLQGLYWISEARLKVLPAAQLAELRDREYLQWLYFQMASVTHMSELIGRKNRLLSGIAAPRPQEVGRGAS